MALLPILRYPDPRLHTVAKPILEVGARIRTLVTDMLETMYAAEGIGLAATQVDHHERLIVIDISSQRDQPLVLINPAIVWSSPQLAQHEEGCLSLPGVYDEVQRPQSIRVRALDSQGLEREIEAQEMLAVCIQHEIDHLEGRVFVDHLSALKRNRIKTRLLKQQRRDEH